MSDPPVDYPGLDGFLGTRGSFMLDFVVVAMAVVLPLLAWSVWLVRVKRNYPLHKRVQLALATILLATVAVFETDMRLNGWTARGTAPGQSGPAAAAWTALSVHLVFSVTTTLLWIVVIGLALWKFPKPAAPGAHSRWHVPLGWAATIDMALTAITGWIFYYLAFAAS